MDKKFLFKLLTVLFYLIAGFAIGFFISRTGGVKQEIELDKNVNYQEREAGSYKFINPLLECEVASGTIDSRKQNFGNELNGFVKSKIDEGRLSDMSVYFRDLNNGPAFGVKEDNPFLPASLLKVPVMMAYFAYAEENPAILKKEVVFEKRFEFPPGKQFINPSQEIKAGTTYTIEQLIDSAIRYSDNQAVLLLYDNIPSEWLLDLYRLLGVNDSVLKDSMGSLTVKEYSRFFRILFNSSFLNRSDSEKALKLLSETEYKNALVAGVPKDIVVSHKFGEAGQIGGVRQLHDCGIIYYPKHPYLLCIMSEGENPADLESSIKDVSRFVYKKISDQY